MHISYFYKHPHTRTLYYSLEINRSLSLNVMSKRTACDDWKRHWVGAVAVAGEFCRWREVGCSQSTMVRWLWVIGKWRSKPFIKEHQESRRWMLRRETVFSFRGFLHCKSRITQRKGYYNEALLSFSAFLLCKTLSRAVNQPKPEGAPWHFA